MRVGFDARWYNDSGVGNYVAGLLTALAEAADDIELVVYEDPANRVPDLQGFMLQRIPIYSSKYSLRAQFELANRCRQDNIDVFHSPFYVVPFAAPCPTVATLHDLIPFLFTIYSWPKQWMVKMGYRAAAFRAAHVITVSHATARDAQEFLGIPVNRISVVHNAVSRQYFQANANRGELSFLRRKYGITPPFVVIQNPRNWRTKNLAVAIEVLALTQRQTAAKFQTVVYGPGPGLNTVTNGHNLGSDVIQTGFVLAEELGMLFRQAQAFLLTSLYEGFGLPLVEAMSCGCPVVSSNGGSLAEVAADGAQVFDPTDVQGMSKALATLLCNAEERERWRTRALERASHFSWRKAAQQTAAVYRHVRHLKHDRKSELALQS